MCDGAYIEQRLRQAVDVIERLPDNHRPRGHRVFWPPIRRSWEDTDWAVKNRLQQPSAAEIDQAQEAMAWLGHLRTVDERRLVSLRVRGQSFHMLAGRRWKFRTMSTRRRVTAEWLRRKFRDACAKIAVRASGQSTACAAHPARVAGVSSRCSASRQRSKASRSK